MNFVIIKSFKHDGSSHRMWMFVDLLKEDSDFYYLAARRAKVIESDGREWRAPEGAVYIMSKKRFYNAIVMFTQGGGIEYYINIASPTIKSANAYLYVDYDLDLKRDDLGSVREIDLGEYQANAKIYGYSDELREVLEKTFKEVESQLKSGSAPFDDKVNKAIYLKYLETVSHQESH
jgi:protein associated with RNAse G/E